MQGEKQGRTQTLNYMKNKNEWTPISLLIATAIVAIPMLILWEVFKIHPVLLLLGVITIGSLFGLLRTLFRLL